MNYLGGLGDGDSILSMLDDLADLFEQAAANRTPIREIVGAADPRRRAGRGRRDRSPGVR